MNGLTIRDVVEAVRAGETLCKQIRQDRDGMTAIEYHLEPSGRHVGPATGASASAQLEPSGDGLLDGMSQTWRAPK